ncbi:MAG: hypothetical protein J5671_06185 [Bacteroidaceae bacterium]|nr:hypothetical protein [Bacteroidaceae bacterium]
MRRFLLRLSLFLLPICIVTVAAEIYVRHIPNSYRIKQQLLDSMGDSVETIILGNSHAYSGIRPELLPGISINLANVSQTTNLDLILLKQCIQRYPNLHNVIAVFDNSNLCDKHMEETDEWFRITYYTLYMKRLGGHNPWLSRYGLELLHFQSFQGKIKKWLQQHRPDCTPLGWDTDNSWAALRDLEAERAQHQTVAEWDSLRTLNTLGRHKIQDESAVEQNICDIEQIAQLCQQHGIRLLLLCTPVRPDYASGIPARQQQLIQQTHKTCSKRYGAISIDLSRDTTFTDSEYFDPDHLTHAGATHLTRILNKKI